MVSARPMARLDDLWRLQEIDSALDTRRASLEDARERLGESEELMSARALAAERASELRAAASTQKDIELEADEIKSKIAPAEEKLYGGTIKNPKELRDLQADIDQLKRHLSSVEDRGLEALTAMEAADTAHRAATAEAEALTSAWEAEQADLRERSARLGDEIAALEAQRKESAVGIDPEILRTYDHVRRAHNGRGIAKLDRNLCLGCRISLPVNLVNKARAGSALVQCPNCERILYA